MALNETTNKLKGLLNQIREDLEKAANGNKAASQRVRTGTIAMEKVAKLYRKESIRTEKSTTGKKRRPAAAKKASAKSKAPAKPQAKAKASPKAKASSKPKAKQKAKAKPKAKAKARPKTKARRTTARPSAFAFRKSSSNRSRRAAAR